MRKNKLLLLLVLLMTVATGAWATDYTTLAVGDVIKVGDTFSPTDDGAFNDFGVSSDKTYTLMRADIDNDFNVDEKTDGAYYVFKYVSIMSSPYIHFEKAFAVTAISDGLEVTKIENMKGKLSYTLALHEPATTTYKITLDEGTGNKDSQNWEITPKSSELSGGETVTVKYNGSREVKSVTVVKKAEKVVDNTYLTWDGTQKKLVAAKIPAEVTTVANADADVEWQAGTYVVEGEVDITGTVELSGDVNLIIKDGAKLTANKIIGNSNKLYIYGQAQMTGELVANCLTDIDAAISGLSTLEVHSAKVTATSSAGGYGGFYSISTFNVYGGLVDSQTTAAGGYGICLKAGGSMNIYGGEVKAKGKGDGDWDCGIVCGSPSNKATITVHGGTLWAGNADKKALNFVTLTIDKSSFSGKIETSGDDKSWTEYTSPETPGSKYVRVGY